MKPKRPKPSGRHAPKLRERVLEGRVRDVTDAGDAVVETTAGIVLASGGALPGETVRVRTGQAHSGVLHGALLDVLTASADRIDPACSIAARCGGCPLMGLEVGAQRNHKRQRVERALAGLCAAEASVKFESPGPELGYRRRTRLAFRRVGTGLVLGFHEHGSRQLVNVERCVVLTPPLSAALEQVRAQLGPLLEGAGEIELEDARGERVAVAVRCERAQAPEVYRAAEQLAKIAPIALVELAVEDLPPARFGEREPPRGSDGLPLQAPAHGFLQVNAQVNARLGDLVRELAQPEGARVLELYAGHGNFTVALAADAANLVAVEGDRRAADACRENLRVRGHTRARVLTSDVRELSLREAFDVIVLDPPRAGAPALAGLVAQTLPARVVYISCHLTTLVRDLRTLHAAGYTADRVHALDMFPQTGHVEAVVRMHRALS